ncbi:MAG: hypothetical protein JRE40_14565 [Deltaproteobacteria bacterium]|nr:hypothetical protein [Deltaproteobacteria bacterium]
MLSIHKSRFLAFLFLVGLLGLTGGFVLAGCAAGPQTFDPDISGPQLIVNPECVSLGTAALLKAKIVFGGSGFVPEDSVFITVFGPDETQVVVADGKVDAAGKFTAPIGTLAKVTGILKGNVSGTYAADGKYKQFVIITQPPIPAGVYTAKVTAMSSDKTAQTKFTFKKPSIVDRLKDWLGKLMGKIKDKKPVS